MWGPRPAARLLCLLVQDEVQVEVEEGEEKVGMEDVLDSQEKQEVLDC